MAKDFITIQEASDLSNKSIQTIRRAIKAKKLQARADANGDLKDTTSTRDADAKYLVGLLI